MSFEYPTQTPSFVKGIQKSEIAAFEDPEHPPWGKEKQAHERFLAYDRWEKGAREFSPFSITNQKGEKETFSQTKVLPLWLCQKRLALSQTLGGKQGMTFTNRVDKACEILSGNNLHVAWVAMRRPYPQIETKIETSPTPKRNYTAHYIPQSDALIVFNLNQTLFRFSVELQVDLVKTITSVPIIELQKEFTVSTLQETLKTLLTKEAVQKDQVLCEVLKEKQSEMESKEESIKLSRSDKKLLGRLERLVDRKGRLSKSTRGKLLPKPLSPKIPAMAFGKAAWAKYFGDVGVEPPLPKDIETILNSPCPIFGKGKVRDTHLLTLIPATVNGKSFNLNLLSELIQAPKGGNKTKYRRYDNDVKNELGNVSAPSHWALMTRDVIPGSRYKSYQDQIKLAKSIAQKARVSYTLPKALEAATSILMEYVKTGRRLYSDKPYTWTRCQEKVDNKWPAAIGGFAAGGLSVHSGDVGGSGIYGVGLLRKF